MPSSVVQNKTFHQPAGGKGEEGGTQIEKGLNGGGRKRERGGVWGGEDDILCLCVSSVSHLHDLYHVEVNRLSLPHHR